MRRCRQCRKERAEQVGLEGKAVWGLQASSLKLQPAFQVVTCTSATTVTAILNSPIACMLGTTETLTPQSERLSEKGRGSCWILVSGPGNILKQP